MNSGGPTSPETYGAILNGAEVCHFEVAFNQPSPYPITGITAWNSSASPYTKIQVQHSVTGVVNTFPLPGSGQKETTGPYSGWFKATVSQAAINSAGYTNFYDIGSYTVF